jgi:hypothetical protein
MHSFYLILGVFQSVKLFKWLIFGAGDEPIKFKEAHELKKSKKEGKKKKNN